MTSSESISKEKSQAKVTKNKEKFPLEGVVTVPRKVYCCCFPYDYRITLPSVFDFRSFYVLIFASLNLIEGNMVNCCVPYCTSYSVRTRKIQKEGGEYVSYHEFPSDLILQAAWLKVISRENFVVNVNSNSSQVCSRHFKENDFIPVKNGRRRLKQGSIPSVFNDYPAYMQPSASSTRKEPKKRRLESSKEMMEVCERNSADIDAANTLRILAVNQPNCPTTTTECPTVEKELKRREFALDEKSRIRILAVNQPNCPTTECPTVEKELKRSEFALEEKSRIRFLAVNQPNGPSTECATLEKELKRREFALEEKSRKLNEKIKEVKKLKRRLSTNAQKLHRMSDEVKCAKNDLEHYTNSIHHKNLKKLLDMEKADCIDVSQLLLLTQLKFMFAKSFRWPESVLRECIQLQTASPLGYRTILERKLVNLPSKSTLLRCSGPVANKTSNGEMVEIGELCNLHEFKASSPGGIN